MAGRFVRSSKYRHVFGRPTRKEQCYDNLRISRNAWDTNLVKANPEYLAVNWEAGGGGAFAVIPLEERGRLPERIPLFRGHTAVVLDTDWNPFNDSLIASGSDDGKVFLWRVPDGFTLHLDVPVDEVKDIGPVGKLSGHSKKVGQVLFNPAAENVLASASGDYSVKIWDIEAGSSKLSLKVGDVIQSLSWSANGSLLVTTSRDKKLRIWDTRQERPAQEVASHGGAKSSRAVWLGEHDRVATTGFSKMSDRQLALWDIKSPNQPLGGFHMLDSISGVCMPFWDDGTQCLYLAGKGDGNIRYYEYENDSLESLSEYKSTDPQRGVAFLPKRGINTHENEVMRAYKTVNDTYIEPISFIVPRRAETFQEDIYPPTTGLKPAMTGKEWFDGAESLPPKISMESLYDGEEAKEVPHDELREAAKAPEPVNMKEPESVKSKEPEPVSERQTVEPPVLTEHRPPASMKEQGATMMTAADKFVDEDEPEDDDDESSFEEVQKPIERNSAARPAIVEPSKVEPVAPVSNMVQDLKATAPSSQESDKTAEQTTDTLSAPMTSTSEGTETDPIQDTPPSAGASNGLDREVRNLKAMMAQQTRQMATLMKTVNDLTAEVRSLKSR